ncbi:MAG: polysaccharide biosynthesis protein PelF [Actinoplanes sp.]|jgi:glycosyltransferase involved in cell wall biosynthesis|nr:polysaccharide biosynthesis protein PelF [Actinoplanes sp.]
MLSAGVRICLLTGGYPYRRNALGGWCDALVRGLPGSTFELVTITDQEPGQALVRHLPGNVAQARAVVLPHDRRRPAEATAAALAAAQLLCRGLLVPGPMVTDGLRRLATDPATTIHPAHQPSAGRAAQETSASHPGGETGAGRRAWQTSAGHPVGGFGGGRLPLDGVPLADVLIDAWRTSRAASGRPDLPRLSVRDARSAAALLGHAVQALAVALPPADLVHCAGGTTPLLAALGDHWRTGRPMLLTEARSAVPRRRPAEERLSPAVRLVLDSLRRSVLWTGYAEATLIAPISSYHHGWARAHGADPGRLVAVPAGADPRDFPAGAEPEHAPALVWAGTGGPDSGLAPLLEAFGHVAAASPTTVLQMTGVTAAHRDHAAGQVGRTGLGHRIHLHHRSAEPRDRYAHGHVVVHVPGAGDPPQRLIEAMMSGRPVVGVDIGPVAETLGDAGVLVPDNDPAALAAACLALLRSPGRRKGLSDAARRRALACFTTDRMARAYGALYADLAGPPPGTAFELAVAPPQVPLPGSFRRPIQADR